MLAQIRRHVPDATNRPLALALASVMAMTPVFAADRAMARPAPDGFADLVEQVAPAVVQISTRGEHVGEEAGATPPPFDDGPERDLLERFFGHRPPLPMPEGRQPRMGLGSGFILSADGLIVTNNHVVGDADEIKVRLRDGREFKAELLGADAKTDLAVLRIHADKPLPVLAWGNSEKARVGDWVLAVGNPFGLDGTVTAGIISSRGRDTEASPYVDFLQIDAPLNRGNSGGPLLNADGQVIGVNTAILSPNGGSVGIGFAIPADTAAKVIAELNDKGEVKRGWLGVAIQPVVPDIAESVGLKEPAGALIAEVMPNSPAAKAGLRQGDVVLTFDGHKVTTPKDLSRAVADTEAGRRAPLTVWRKGKEVEAKVAVAEMPQAKNKVAANETTPERAKASVDLAALGLSLGQSKDRSADADASERVVVTAVDREKDAAEKGIRPGDIILKVNDTAVTSTADVVKALDEAKAERRSAVLLLIESSGAQRFVPVKLSSA